MGKNPYLNGYSIEDLKANIMNNPDCTDFPFLRDGYRESQLVASIVDNRLVLLNVNPDFTYTSYNFNPYNPAQYDLPTGFYKFDLDIYAKANNALGYPRISVTDRLTSDVFIRGFDLPLGHTFIYGEVEDSQQAYTRVAIYGEASTVTFNSIYCYPISNDLLHGVKRPPHAVLDGKDASNFDLTNPA